MLVGDVRRLLASFLPLGGHSTREVTGQACKRLHHSANGGARV